MNKENRNYHIFVNYNFYNLKFREFVLKNFNDQNHIFVFRKKKSEKYHITEGKTIYASNFIKLLRLLPKLITSKNIYIHYLPNGPSIIFWALLFFMHKKIVWVYWGGDIYIYQNPKNTLSEKIYEYSRKVLIRRIKYIAGFLPGDFDLIKKWYRTNATYIQIIYPSPIEIDFSLHNNKNSKKIKQILIGNSADPSNNHIEALSLLGKFKLEPVKIICPLSYGGNKEYIENVIKVGTDLFHEKFVPLIHLLPANEYNLILQEIDIAIMCHNRQQGLGNILLLLSNYCKVFVKPDITTFSYFQSIGIKIFSTQEIGNLDFTEFISFDSQCGGKNKELIKEYFNDSTFVYLWRKALNL